MTRLNDAYEALVSGSFSLGGFDPKGRPAIRGANRALYAKFNESFPGICRTCSEFCYWAMHFDEDDFMASIHCPVCNKRVPFQTGWYSRFCSSKCSNLHPDVQESIRETTRARYGVDRALRSDVIKQRSRDTYRRNWGADHYMQSEAGYQRFAEGVDRCFGGHHFSQEWCKSLIEATHKRNGRSYLWPLEDPKNRGKGGGTSKEELEAFEMLKEIYPELKLHHKDNSRYPFVADFYDKETDTFFEYQGFYAHGPGPFNPDDQKHLDLLKSWRARSENSGFEKSCLYIWEESDPGKRDVAKANGIKLIEFWSLNDVRSYVERLKFSTVAP